MKIGDILNRLASQTHLKDPKVIWDLLYTYQQSKDETQSYIITRLLEICQQSLHNPVLLLNNSVKHTPDNTKLYVLNFLVDLTLASETPDKIFDLISFLVFYCDLKKAHIEHLVKHVKEIDTCELSPERISSHCQKMLLILRFLQLFLASPRMQPPYSYFYFNGHGSGILIDPFVFPFKKALSVCVWIRIENSTEVSRVFSFHCKGFGGVEAYIVENSLFYRALGPEYTLPAKGSNGIHLCILPDGVWTYFAFYHKAKDSLHKNQLKLVVNDCETLTSVMDFPIVGEKEVTNAGIGLDLYGQISCLIIFDDVFPVDRMKTLYQNFNFGPQTNEALIGMERFLAGGLANHLTLLLHPSRSSQKSIFSVSSSLTGHFFGISGQKSLHPRKITSLGGLSVLLPILSKILELENSDLFTEWFRLLTFCLKDRPDNQNEAVSSGFFKLLSVMLEDVTDCLLSEEILNIFEDLKNCGNSHMNEQIFKKILWNLKIWCKSEIGTQIRLFGVIKEMYEKDKSLLKVVGLEVVMDCLVYVSVEECQEKFGEVLKWVLVSCWESGAVEGVVRYLSLKMNSGGVGLVLRVIRMVIGELGQSGFVRQMVEAKGIEVLMSLLGSRNSKIKYACVCVLEQLLTVGKFSPGTTLIDLHKLICKKFDPESPAKPKEFDTFALENSAVGFQDFLVPPRISCTVVGSRSNSRRSSFNMTEIKWDEVLYHSGLEIMLGRVVEGPCILDDNDFIHSSLGLKILMFIGEKSSADVKHRVLQDQLMLTKWNDKNCAILIQHPDWHFWLLNLILETFDTAEAADAIVDIGIRLHNTVLLKAMSLPDGYLFFSQLSTWLEMNSIYYQSKPILQKLLENFLNSLRRIEYNSSTHWKNFVLFGYFLEEFVLYLNCKAKKSLAENLNFYKTWEDSLICTNYANLIKSLWTHSFGKTIEEFFQRVKDQSFGRLKEEAGTLNFEPENDLKKRGKFGGVLFHLLCHALKATEDELRAEFWLEILGNLIKTILYISAVNFKTLTKQESRFYSYCISYTIGFLCQTKQKHPCVLLIDNSLAHLLKLIFASLSYKEKKSKLSGLKSMLKLPLTQYYYPCDYIIQMLYRATPDVENWIKTFSNFTVREIQQCLFRIDIQNALFYLLFQVQSFFHSEERTAQILQDREKNSEKYINENSNMLNQTEINLMRLEENIRDTVHEIRVSENAKLHQRQTEKEFKLYKRKQQIKKILEQFIYKDTEKGFEVRLEKKICKDYSRPFLTRKSANSKYISAKNKQHLPDVVIPSIHLTLVEQSSFFTEEEDPDILEEMRTKITEDSSKTSGFSSPIGLITPMAIKYGQLFLKSTKSEQKLIFRYDRSVQESNETGLELFKFSPIDTNFTYTKTWKLSRLTTVFTKSYLMKPTALELIFLDGKNITLNFLSTSDHIEFLLELKRFKKILPNIKIIKPKVLIKSLSFSSYKAQTVIDSSVTEKWQNGQISNFEYLMHLNYTAGRSYNDLTQYPIMPWVISDYSSTLPNTRFRDLSKNMGSLGTETRTGIFEDRYKNIQTEGSDPPFHFGSHYSNPGITLFYLIRLAPFDDCSKELQGGKFDLPDRLFNSISESFFLAIDDIADVRELIPEFFFLPEMFLNVNQIDLGVTQSGETVSDVKLPVWAENAYEFVRIHREVLESDSVSASLHKWIDLIFGFKQLGIEAEKAMNVFFYLTYEKNVNLEKITDEGLMKILKTQMYYFGRTPSQLFTKPHPAKKISKGQENLFTSTAVVKVFLSGQSKLKANPSAVHSRAIVKMKLVKDKEIFCIRSNRSLTKYSFSRSGHENCFFFTCDPIQNTEYIKDSLLSIEDASIPYFNLPFTFVNQCRTLVLGGFWDGRVQIRKPLIGEVLNLKFAHYSTVTCIEVSDSETFAVSGSKDGDCVFWIIKGELWVYKCSFASHDDEVTCVAISEDLGVFATGSFDGCCNLYSIYELKLVNSLSVPCNKPITIVRFSVSSPSRVFLYSPEDRSIYGFSVNGVCVNVIQEGFNVLCMAVVQSGNFSDYLVYGNDKGEITFRNSGNFDLIRICSLNLSTPIVTFIFTSDLKTLLIGCSDGEIAILTH